MKSSSSTNSGECTYDSYVKKFGSAEGMLRWKPKCGCGDMATLRRASTVTNYGRQFWGCRNYKGSTQPGCGYFQWFYDDAEDEKDHFMRNQKSRLEKLEHDIDAVKMEVECLKKKITELQNQSKKSMKIEKIWRSLFCLLLVVVVVRML
ncbi:uncharacterized protein LOC131657445 [Vicia villosa]|uniref:uncharacterized protein LOC131657445 n=1 Tax=Vicia villosa TaxID=3911 RepID=UPI00273ACFC4|nr:uncharacterized protein LOC131657445 [Vicia villosa]